MADEQENANLAAYCLKCDSYLDQVILTSYRIRQARLKPVERSYYFSRARALGIWQGGSVTAPVITAVNREFADSNMIMNLGPQIAFENTPIENDLLSSSKITGITRLNIVDAPLETTAYTIRQKCHDCGSNWSVITVNYRLVIFSRYVADYVFDGRTKSILPVIESLNSYNSALAHDFMNKSHKLADDIIEISELLFLAQHEEMHVDAPSFNNTPFGQYSEMSRVEKELFCDYGAFVKLLDNYSSVYNELDHDVALHPFIGVCVLLIALRVLSQVRAYSPDPPCISVYPSYEDRISQAFWVCDKWIRYKEKDSRLLGRKRYLTRKFNQAIANFDKEIVSVQ